MIGYLLEHMRLRVFTVKAETESFPMSKFNYAIKRPSKTDADDARRLLFKTVPRPPSITDVLHYLGLLTACISTRHNATDER